MRNKWYVAGILVAALLLTWGAVHAALGESGALVAIVPGALAVALFAAAYKVAKADSFAPNREQRWDDTGGPKVRQWLNDRAEGPPPKPAHPTVLPPR